MGILVGAQACFFGLFARHVRFPREEEMELSPQLYVMLRDLSLMVFFGFGFLMAFLKRYGYSAIGLSLITSCLVVQESLLLEAAFNTQGGGLSLATLVNALCCGVAVLISAGANLGKLTPCQLLLLALLEAGFYWANSFVYTQQLGAHDAAGGVVVHAFGCYFGLSVSGWLDSAELVNLPSSSPRSPSSRATRSPARTSRTR